MAVAVAAFIGASLTGVDDADITMVYARNIARGLGYVYTPGGERVEGSTSLGWTLLAASMFRFGAESMMPMVGASLILTAAAVAAALRASQIAGETRSALAASATAVFLLASPAYFAWTTATLMDVAFWSAAVVFATGLAMSPSSPGRNAGLALAGVGVVVARPEGLLLAPALVVLAGFAHWAAGNSPGDSVRAIRWPALAVIAALVGVFAFRLVYFGFPFPNTYYAKVGGNRADIAWRGIRYLARFFYAQPVHILTAICVLRVVWVYGPQIRPASAAAAPLTPASRARLTLCGMLLLAGSLPLIEGEDHFAGLRMMQPFVPLSCALLASEGASLFRESGRLRRIGILVAVVSAVAAGWVRFVRVDVPALQAEKQLALDGRALAARLSEVMRPGGVAPSVGVTAAGGFAFEYQGRVQDLLGLNWVAMAHASSDRRGMWGHAAFSQDVFWADSPSLLVLQVLEDRPQDACDLYNGLSRWQDHLFKGLISTARFRTEYVGVAAPSRGGWLAGFARRDWTERQPLRDGIALDWPLDSMARADCRAQVEVAGLAWPAPATDRSFRTPRA